MKFFFSILFLMFAGIGFASTNLPSQKLSDYPLATTVSSNDFVLLNQKSGTNYILKRLPVSIVNRPIDTTNFVTFNGDCQEFGGRLTNSATGGSVTLAGNEVIFNQRAGYDGTNFWQYSDDGSTKLFLHIYNDGQSYWSAASSPTPPIPSTLTVTGAGVSAVNGTYTRDDTTAIANGYLHGWISLDGDYFGTGGSKIAILIKSDVSWVGTLDVGYYRSDTVGSTDPTAISDWYNWYSSDPVPTITAP